MSKFPIELYSNNNILYGGKPKTKRNIKTKTTNKYKCDYSKKFSDICMEDPSGHYNSHDKCINDCEGKYVCYQLKKAGLQHEANIYYKFIKELLRMNIDVYLKGGNPLGLLILKMISQKYTDKKDFEKQFNKFLELSLVKDWDFHCYTHREIDEQLKKELDDLAYKHQLVSRSRTFILYQTKKPIQILETALFEISIWEKDNYSDLESVMSTMKIRINQYNLKYVFMLAKSFYSYIVKKNPIDIDVIMRAIKKINVIIYPHVKGFFIVDDTNFNDGGLSAELLNFIHKFVKKHNYNENLEQFLVAHIKEPKRMYFRLLEKNLPKAEKILKFINDANLSDSKAVPNWLLNPADINELVKLFTSDLSELIMVTFNKSGIKGVLDLFKNVKFKPIKDEYARFTDKGLGHIYNLLHKLFEQIKPNLSTYASDFKDDDKGGLLYAMSFLDSESKI